MEKEELEGYEYQLAQIKQSLAENPENAELLALEEELTQLIAMTREYLGLQPGSSSGATAGPSSASTSTAKSSTNAAGTAGAPSSKSQAAFTAGTEVLAKWHVDGKMYPARIASVSGSSTDPVYTVIFKVDNSTEVLRAGDIKPMKDYGKKRGYDSGYEKDSAGSGKEGATESEAKKLKKTEKKAVKEDERKARVAEQNAKQSSWQSFAKKGAKKGIKIAGFTGESQFRSPDNPYGRVGVVGSGKGVTQYAEKKRAVFNPTDGQQ